MRFVCTRPDKSPPLEVKSEWFCQAESQLNSTAVSIYSTHVDLTRQIPAFGSQIPAFGSQHFGVAGLPGNRAAQVHLLSVYEP